jgi:hypothetical protein
MDGRNERTPNGLSGDLANASFEEVDAALRAVLATLASAREWVHTLSLKAIAIRALELYPQATHLWLEDGDQSMTAVTGTELFADEQSLGYDWEDDDDLSDLVRQLDSEQMDEWGCVEVSRNGTSPLWKLDLAAAAKLPMKSDT